MLTIKVNAIAAQIIGEVPNHTADALFKALAYEMENLQMAKAIFRNSRGKINSFLKFWDGVNRLYNKKNQTLPTGNLYEALEILTSHHLDYEVQYTLEAPRAQRSLTRAGNLHPFRDAGKAKLRDYQDDLVTKLTAHYRSSAQAPTGSGKSIVLADLCRTYSAAKILVCVPNLYLLHQTRGDLAGFFGEPVGIWGDGEYEDQRVVVATVQSLSKDLPDLKKPAQRAAARTEAQLDRIAKLAEFTVVLYDEAHLVASDSHRILGYFLPNALVRHGVSATLRREDGAEKLLEGIIGPKVHEVSIEELVKRKLLTPMQIVMHEFQHAERETRGNWKDTVENTLKNIERTRFGIKLLEEMLKTMNKVLVLYRFDEHGQQILEEIKALVPDCMLINGKASAKKRQEAVAALESGKIRVLIASTILDVGANIPCVQGLLPMAAGSGANVLMQRVGRILRPFPGKKVATVYDIFDLDDHHLEKQSTIRLQAYIAAYGPERVTRVRVNGRRERMW